VSSLPTLDGAFFWGLFRKNWAWLIPAMFLCIAVASAGVLAFFRPSYQARFRLEVDPSTFVVFKDGSVRPSSEFVDLQKAILLGNSVLEKAVADRVIASVPAVSQAKDPVAFLREEVRVTSTAGYRLMDVRFEDPDPTSAANVVNTLVDEYLRTRRAMDEIRTSTQERNVLAALSKAEAEVEAAKARVRDLSVQAVKTDTLVGESESGRIDTSYLDGIRMQRMELTSELAILELNLAEVEAAYKRDQQSKSDAGVDESKPVEITEEILDRDVVVGAVVQQLENAKTALRDLETATNVGAKNPIYIQASRRVEMLEKELVRTRENRKVELATRGVMASADARRDRINALRDKVAQMKTKRDVLENQVKEYLTSLKQSSATSVDLQFAEADLQEWNTIRATVHNRRIQLQTERDAMDSVRELERAIAPRLPVEELPYKQLALGAMAGAALPFLIGLLLEIRSRRVDDAGQLESRTRLSVLGEISTIPVATNGKLSKRKRSHARELRLFEESVDSLSTTLILREDLKGAQVFTITSALSGEGKTSVSCQLVVSMARATGKKVLLIDGDLRAPDVHHVFGRQMTPGLVGYLSGDGDWRDYVDREWNESIHILSAGYLKGSPHRLMSSGRYERMIAEAREEYGFVVVDTPPVLPASEALLFATAADAVLICALRDKSRIEQMIQAFSRMESAGAKVAGSVLSGVPVKEYASYYGDYYESKA
jgi:capsular exopolysaccharide synthesis family protein